MEEREEPMLQQVESVAVVGSREVTPMPGEIKDELEQLSEASHLTEVPQRNWRAR